MNIVLQTDNIIIINIIITARINDIATKNAAWALYKIIH